MKEKIIEILESQLATDIDDDGHPIYSIYEIDLPVVVTQFEHLVNQEVEKRIKERIPSEEWNYCPYCGMDWVKDSEAFGCWCCGKSRSRLTNQKTEGGWE